MTQKGRWVDQTAGRGYGPWAEASFGLDFLFPFWSSKKENRIHFLPKLQNHLQQLGIKILHATPSSTHLLRNYAIFWLTGHRIDFYEIKISATLF